MQDVQRVEADVRPDMAQRKAAYENNKITCDTEVGFRDADRGLGHPGCDVRTIGGDGERCLDGATVIGA